MKTNYVIGIMLEEVTGWHAEKTYYRVFSGKMQGPVWPTRRGAFWHWFTNRFFIR